MEPKLIITQDSCSQIEINGLELSPNEAGVVTGFTDDTYAQKYLCMGIIPGSYVRLIRKAPFGKACYFKIDGRSLAVRKKEAECLILQRVENNF